VHDILVVVAVLVLAEQNVFPQPLPDLLEGLQMLLQSQQEQLVIEVGGNDVVLDIRHQLVDELDVLDVLLDQQLLVEVVADPIGQLFKKKSAFFIHLILWMDFQQAQNPILALKGYPLGQTQVTANRKHPGIFHGIGGIGEL